MKLLTKIKTTPTTIEIIIAGTAIFISFKTPEKDVNVEDPVKFIAKKAEIEGKMSKYPSALKMLC